LNSLLVEWLIRVLVMNSLLFMKKHIYQLFCKYGINPYLQPLNQSTNQPINDICNMSCVNFFNPER
jgi:hypothetical protein